jgi:hypothetical protein
VFYHNRVAVELYDSWGSNLTWECNDFYGSIDSDFVRMESHVGTNGNIGLKPHFCDTALAYGTGVSSISPLLAANDGCGFNIGNVSEACSCCRGIAGNVDFDPDERIDIGDLTMLIQYLYVPAHDPPQCLAEANVDGDEQNAVDIGDLTALIAYLYIPPNPEPAPCQ